MFVRRSIVVFASVAAMLAALDGCAGGGLAPRAPQGSFPQPGTSDASSAPALSQTTAVADMGAEHYYLVSDFLNNTVDVYGAPKNRLIRQITGFNGPAGLATDQRGNLYVADSGNASIDIYAPPYSGPRAAMIPFTGQVPLGIAMLRRGAFAVVSYAQSGGNGGVTLSDAGGATPCAIGEQAPASTALAHIDFAAYDSLGNLYVDGTTASGDVGLAIVRNAQCQKNPVFAPLTIPNTLGGIGGIALDRSNDIVVADSVNGALDIYPPYRAKYTLGKPTIVPLSGSSSPRGIALNEDASTVYVADAGGSLFAFAYPSGAPLGTVLDGLEEPFSVAVSLPEAPKALRQLFITSGTTFTVPADFNPSNNEIQVIGGSGGGAYGQAMYGPGGGGGGYAALSDAPLVAGSTVTVAVGAAGVAGTNMNASAPGGDTYVCAGQSSCTSISDSGVIVGAGGGGAGDLGASSAAAGGAAPFGSTGVAGFPGGAGGFGSDETFAAETPRRSRGTVVAAVPMAALREARHPKAITAAKIIWGRAPEKAMPAASAAPGETAEAAVAAVAAAVPEATVRNSTAHMEAAVAVAAAERRSIPVARAARTEAVAAGPCPSKAATGAPV